MTKQYLYSSNKNNNPSLPISVIIARESRNAKNKPIKTIYYESKDKLLPKSGIAKLFFSLFIYKHILSISINQIRSVESAA